MISMISSCDIDADDSSSVSSTSTQSSMKSIAPPEQLEQQGYPDLTNQVKYAGGRFAVHTGGYSDVYIGYLLADPSSEIAIKVLRTTDKQEEIETIRKHLNREASVWHKLRHRNVLRFLGLASGLGRFENCPALIAPYCRNGTVGDYVRQSNPPVGDRVRLILGVARGLEYLHGEGIVHGDLKPSNVLMSDQYEPLLCDFGRSSIVNTRGFTTRPAGTLRYQARELLEGTIVPNKSTDICALGLTAFEIWTGVQPFNEIRNDNALFMHILIRNAQLQLPGQPPAKADRLWPILSSCFHIEPENRPEIQKVVERLESCVRS